MSVWPTTLPKPMNESFSENMANNVIRSSMDRGPAKVRRRTTANIREIAFSMMLTETQLTALETFYNVTTVGGAAEFDYTHPRTGVIESARFKEPFSYRDTNSNLFTASVSLEILP